MLLYLLFFFLSATIERIIVSEGL